MRSRCGMSRRTSSPDSIITALALVWSRNASSVTAGSSWASSSRKRSRSPIDRLLERIEAEPAIGVDEAFAVLARAEIDVGHLFDRIDDAVLVEAGAGDAAESGILRTRAAEQQLVILGALTIDAEDADVAGMVMAAGVDAAADLELQLAQFALAPVIGEARGDLLRDRDRAGIGEAAIIETGAGDDVADQVEIGVGQAGVVERLPDGVEIGLADVRQDDVLGVGHAQLVEAVALGEVGDQFDLLGGGVAGDAAVLF